ncbi:MAG: flavodoxin family protein [Saccharospirillaceae bacterium]|nr:flavodoxin family protein [Saccharospirillaceae bacterium]
MINIAVVYFTKTDITGTLAKTIIKTVESQKDVNVIEFKIEGPEIIEGRFVNDDIFLQLDKCAAIIFGTPTYMGGVSAQFKAFADATSELWCSQKWAGKIAAGFTSGSALNGDQTSTLQYLVTLSNQHGMYWVGLDSALGFNDKGLNRLGCQLGVVAQSADGLLHKTDLKTAEYLAQRVVNLARQLK